MTDQRRSRYTSTIISTSKHRTWLPLFIGLAFGLVGLHFTVSRPMRKQWEKELFTVRRDLKRMASSLQKVASVGTQAQKTNSLLAAMNDQQSLLRDSQKTLKLVENLTARIESQKEKLSNSYSALENLAELQDRILERAGTDGEAMRALDRTMEFQSRLVSRSRDLDEAEEIAGRYANLKDSLTISAKDLPIAEQNLDRWIGMQDRIVEEATTTKTAQNNLTAILDLQTRLAKNSIKTESAVGAAISEIVGSLPKMSQKAIEFASLHTVVANLRRIVEPLAKAAKSTLEMQETGQAQSVGRSAEQAPLVAPRPQKKDRNFFSDWERFSLGGQ